MIDIQNQTYERLLPIIVGHFGHLPLLIAPKDAKRSYHRDGYEISYTEASEYIFALVEQFRTKGYGHGHRIVLDMENRPEHFLIKMAMNVAGISCVPINADLRSSELAYILDDSQPVLAIVSSERQAAFKAAFAHSKNTMPVIVFERLLNDLPAARSPFPNREKISPESEASLLYTSGTTGKPKGCILSQGYELVVGQWYTTRGGALDIQPACERIYNPLPVYHINSLIVSFIGAFLTGNCQIQPARFSATNWWTDIDENRATIFHYLGIIIPVLLNLPQSPHDTNHFPRLGLGAGVEPTLHDAFQKRFDIPLVEGWGMTEMCRLLVDFQEPRKVGTRAIGRASDTLQARVVDENDKDVPIGQPGEMLLRHSAQTPRAQAFSGYLNREAETEHAWRGGWFHTGDTVRMDESGMIYFVDRKKNIIRRSGENIAAGEIEALLQEHEAVANVAVLAVPDDVYDEEVYACIVLQQGATDDTSMAQSLFDYCFTRLAYYKAPGWILFVGDLPVTGTQKIQKHQIFNENEDPTTLAAVHDFRAQKKRK